MILDLESKLLRGNDSCPRKHTVFICLVLRKLEKDIAKNVLPVPEMYKSENNLKIVRLSPMVKNSVGPVMKRGRAEVRVGSITSYKEDKLGNQTHLSLNYNFATLQMLRP